MNERGAKDLSHYKINNLKGNIVIKIKLKCQK